MKETPAKNIPLNERVQFLRDSCDKVVKFGYHRSFSENEMSERKNQLANTLINISRIEEEKKDTMDSFKERLKPLDKDKKNLIDEIKLGSEFIEEECFQIFNHNDKMVETYNKFGEMVESRRMRPEEQQKTIFSEVTGTNN